MATVRVSVQLEVEVESRVSDDAEPDLRQLFADAKTQAAKGQFADVIDYNVTGYWVQYDTRH
jgi:hypothetical protein